MSMAFEFDGSGIPLCPLAHVAWGYPDDVDAREKTPTMTVCGEPVRLVATLQYTIGPGEVVKVWDNQEADAWGWEVKCDRGHVLATSADDSGNGEAEPFRWDVVFPAPEKPWGLHG